MFRVIIAYAVFSLAAAAVIPDDAQAQIINYQSDNDGSGNYKYSFETSNGIQRQEIGRLVHAGEVNQHVEVKGSFSYIDADGKIVAINYIADENGYQIKLKGFSYTLPTSVVATLLGK